MADDNKKLSPGLALAKNMALAGLVFVIAGIWLHPTLMVAAKMVVTGVILAVIAAVIALAHQ